jgi:hypothetical protein
MFLIFAPLLFFASGAIAQPPVRGDGAASDLAASWGAEGRKLGWWNCIDEKGRSVVIHYEWAIPGTMMQAHTTSSDGETSVQRIRASAPGRFSVETVTPGLEPQSSTLVNEGQSATVETVGSLVERTTFHSANRMDIVLNVGEVFLTCARTTAQEGAANRDRLRGDSRR